MSNLRMDYEPIITKSDEANMFEVKLQPVPPEDLREEILSNATEVNQETDDTSGKSASNEKDEKPSFGTRPNTKDPDFDFKKELERLPFELNIGDALLTRKQQACLIDVIYDHTEVFSLFDGDLGFCDVLKHSIPTTTDKPVYLPHRQIPVQLQSEVRKCLDNWLKQGIIRPSKSPYASQVVIVHKKLVKFASVSILENLTQFISVIRSHCLVLRKPFKPFRPLSGFLVSI